MTAVGYITDRFLSFLGIRKLLSLIGCFVLPSVQTSDLFHEDAHLEFGNHARASCCKVLEALIEVFLGIVRLLTHFLKGCLNEKMSLVDIKRSITIVIELVPYLFNNCVDNVAYVFVVFFFLVFRHFVSLFFLQSEIALFL